MPRARILGLAALLAIPFAPAAGHASTPSLIVFSADRAPLLTEQIYRLDPNGSRVDLGQSPVGDDAPVVSPDGKKVAFLSYRNSVVGHGPQIFEMGIDGTKVRDMAPSLSGAVPLAWQPHGDRLAAIAQTTIGGPFTLWILRWGHKPIRLVADRQRWMSHATRAPSWSPDGRVLVAWSDSKWQAFSPAGRRLWTHESPDWGGCCESSSSWSAHGLLAVTTEQKLRVYDESGKTRFKARLPKGPVGPPAWSPSGRKVGFVTGGTSRFGQTEAGSSCAGASRSSPSARRTASSGRATAGSWSAAPTTGRRRESTCARVGSGMRPAVGSTRARQTESSRQ